jgi:hypothetical protein
MNIQATLRHLAKMTLVGLALLPRVGMLGQSPQVTGTAVPRMWDDEAMRTLEVPLANPIGSPKHVSADYYYRIPVRSIYKQYPVYAPGREPAGYMEWLKKQDPVIVWDDASHKPKLQTEADWIKAGEIAFDAPSFYSTDPGGFRMEDVTSNAWYEKSGMPLTSDGVLPFMHYVIREKGKIELGSFSCGMCHTRVMPGGAILKGAQGNCPSDAARAQGATIPRLLWQALFDMPWLHPDPLDRLKPLSEEQVRILLASVPAGVAVRHRGSLFEPIQIPDLIGVRDRHYLDRTGLQQHRSIVDLMRYAALNQGGDALASYDGFIPADIPKFKTLPEPKRRGSLQRRAALCTLALHLFPQATTKPEPIRRIGSARPEDLRARRMRRLSHAASLYQQQTHSRGRLHGPGRRPREV